MPPASTSKPSCIATLAQKLLGLPTLRMILIACLNFLFISKTFKNYFEKIVFNPYFIPSIKEDQIRSQAKSILQEIGDVNGKTLLELGPRGDCLLACHLLRAGAQKIFLLDINNYIHIPKTEISKYQSVYPQVLDTNGNLNTDKIEVISYNKDGSIPLPIDSVHIIYSLAVFEHIRNPSYIIRETWRVLKPRGTAYHQIDFRDHIFQQSSLLFLLFPDKLFNFLFSHTGMWTNRIRYSEWRAIFIKNKFLITKEKIDTLPINSLKPHYVKKLGHLSQDDLLAAGGWFLLIK